jgi:hypothetical protein
MLLHEEMVLDWINLNQICQNTWNPHQFYTTHETATCRVTVTLKKHEQEGPNSRCQTIVKTVRDVV